MNLPSKLDRMMLSLRSATVLALMIVFAGCASASPTGSTQKSSSRAQNVLTREEILAAGIVNMQDIIAQLRPQYLRGRGQSSITQGKDVVAVYLDGVSLGGPNSLRTIAASSVQRVEFISGGDTTAKFGLNHPAGVIHVFTK